MTEVIYLLFCGSAGIILYLKVSSLNERNSHSDNAMNMACLLLFGQVLAVALRLLIWHPATSPIEVSQIFDVCETIFLPIIWFYICSVKSNQVPTMQMMALHESIPIVLIICYFIFPSRWIWIASQLFAAAYLTFISVQTRYKLHLNQPADDSDADMDHHIRYRMQYMTYPLIALCVLHLLATGCTPIIWPYYFLCATLAGIFMMDQLLSQEYVVPAYIGTPQASSQEMDDTLLNFPAAQIKESLDKLVAERFYLNNDVNITTLAKEIGTNRTYLSRYLNEVLHTGFNEYINNLRLDYAHELINDRTMRMAEISARCGFSNDRTFRSAFTKKYGCSPSEYRKHIVWRPTETNFTEKK